MIAGLIKSYTDWGNRYGIDDSTLARRYNSGYRDIELLLPLRGYEDHDFILFRIWHKK